MVEDKVRGAATCAPRDMDHPLSCDGSPCGNNLVVRLRHYRGRPLPNGDLNAVEHLLDADNAPVLRVADGNEGIVLLVLVGGAGHPECHLAVSDVAVAFTHLRHPLQKSCRVER